MFTYHLPQRYCQRFSPSILSSRDTWNELIAYRVSVITLLWNLKIPYGSTMVVSIFEWLIITCYEDRAHIFWSTDETTVFRKHETPKIVIALLSYEGLYVPVVTRCTFSNDETWTMFRRGVHFCGSIEISGK